VNPRRLRAGGRPATIRDTRSLTVVVTGADEELYALASLVGPDGIDRVGLPEGAPPRRPRHSGASPDVVQIIAEAIEVAYRRSMRGRSAHCRRVWCGALPC
jgi:hypothetical protein